MRAKSAVIIRVASKFSSPAAGVRRRNLRTEAERRACAASGDGATYLTHGVVQNLSRVYTFYLSRRRGPDRAAWLGSVAVRGLQRPGTGRLVSSKFVSPITSV